MAAALARMLRLLRRLIQLDDVLNDWAAAAVWAVGDELGRAFSLDFILFACELKNAFADETILFGLDSADGGVDGMDRSPNGLANSLCVAVSLLLLEFVFARSFVIKTNSKRYNSCTRFFKSWHNDRSTIGTKEEELIFSYFNLKNILEYKKLNRSK